jgi:hypothetical protein
MGCSALVYDFFLKYSKYIKKITSFQFSHYLVMFFINSHIYEHILILEPGISLLICGNKSVLNVVTLSANAKSSETESFLASLESERCLNVF